MEKTKKQTGFTLIELMLVLAVIAAISVIGLNAYRQQLTNFQVDKTALQMQQWLEAAAAYYVKNNAWPAIPSGYASCTAVNQVLEGNVNLCGPSAADAYIATGSIDTNPWGQPYVLIPPANSGGPFTVRTTVSASPQSKNLANQIAARLPNASTISLSPLQPPSYTVSAAITAPGQGAGIGIGKILSMKQVIEGDKIPFPSTDSAVAYSCPAGADSNLQLAITEFNTNDKRLFILGVDVSSTPDEKNKQWTAHMNIETTKGALHSGTMLAIVTCLPISTSPAANNTAFKF
jgi:type IV pilus assembly protein PilA